MRCRLLSRCRIWSLVRWSRSWFGRLSRRLRLAIRVVRWVGALVCIVDWSFISDRRVVATVVVRSKCACRWWVMFCDVVRGILLRRALLAYR